MPVKYKYRQISLKDAFSDCQDMFVDDAPTFFQLLNERCAVPSQINAFNNYLYYENYLDDCRNAIDIKIYVSIEIQILQLFFVFGFPFCFPYFFSLLLGKPQKY